VALRARWPVCVSVRMRGWGYDSLIEFDEYAVANNLLDAPAFAWWATHVIKKRISVIAAVTKRYHKRTSLDDCVRLDK
jgi:hypothetical protein